MDPRSTAQQLVTISTNAMPKPKIPIYPRPVSPLTAEPLLANPGDTYLDDSSDSHGDDEQRAAKRRRIEKLGEQYLRGDGLFIMTAGLRGPLTGWVNPWSTKHGRKAATRAETFRQYTGEGVPETALSERRPSASVAPVKSSSRNVARGPYLQSKISQRMAGHGEHWLKTVEDDNRYLSSARDASPTPIRKKDRIRNSNHLTSTNQVPHFETRPEAASARSRLPAAVSKQPMQDERICSTTTLPSDSKRSSRADVHPSLQLESFQPGVPAELPTTNFLPVHPDPPLVEQGDFGMTNPGEGDRRLDFNRKSRRRSIQKAPPSTHLPEFEYRLVADPLKSLEGFQAEQTISGEGPDAIEKPRDLDFVLAAETPIAKYQGPSNEQTNSERQAECTTEESDVGILKVTAESGIAPKPVQSASMPPGKMLPPSLSTQTSTTTNTNAIPSAQVIPAIQPPSVESYTSTADKMIEPEISPTQNQTRPQHSPSANRSVPIINEQHEQRAAIVAKSTTPDATWRGQNPTDKDERPRVREGIVPFSAFKSPPAHASVSELNTQEMLAAITPLGFSTVKKIPLKSLNKVTPATATRMQPQKLMKRASFAPPPAADAMSSGSSQSSIKGSLKVSKMVDKRTKARESPKRAGEPSLFGKLGLDMETSDEDGVAAEAESLLELSSLLRKGPHPKAAPISSGPLPTPNTSTSNGSIQQQDAQQERGGGQENGRHGGGGQDDFNLVSAMDDLGSFLGTWDADKEAREVGAVTSSSCVKSVLTSRGSLGSARR